MSPRVPRYPEQTHTRLPSCAHLGIISSRSCLPPNSLLNHVGERKNKGFIKIKSDFGSFSVSFSMAFVSNIVIELNMNSINWR